MVVSLNARNEINKEEEEDHLGCRGPVALGVPGVRLVEELRPELRGLHVDVRALDLFRVEGLGCRV